jgi:ketosteroid isomerase-like protein
LKVGSTIFLDALANDLTWTATGSSPTSGTYHGKQEYLEKVYRALDERLVAQACGGPDNR